MPLVGFKGFAARRGRERRREGKGRKGENDNAGESGNIALSLLALALLMRMLEFCKQQTTTLQLILQSQTEQLNVISVYEYVNATNAPLINRKSITLIKTAIARSDVCICH